MSNISQGLISSSTYSILSLNGYFLLFIGFVFGFIFLVREVSGGNGFVQHKIFSFIVALYVAFVMFLYPIEGDKFAYDIMFSKIKEINVSDAFTSDIDIAFYIFNKLILSFFDSHHVPFFAISFIYVFGYRYFSYSVAKLNATALFISYLCYFQFYAYGVNTLRAGLACTLFLIGITRYEFKKSYNYWFFLSVLVHVSFAIPLFALLIQGIFKKNKYVVFIWIITLVVSFVAGDYFKGILSLLSGYESNLSNYINANNDRYRQGFRWDFVLFSFFAVAVGYLFIETFEFKSKFYVAMWRTYVLANCFWLLVIDAAFSDRFAFLSWFLFPFIIIYPTLVMRDGFGNKRLFIVMFSVNYLFSLIMYIK